MTAKRSEPFDVAIVGARIGGAVLAAFLGDAGHNVLLLDRATFSSDTISTHFFRGAGLAGVLDELGLLGEVHDLGAPRLDREYLSADGGSEPMQGEPQTPGSVGPGTVTIVGKPSDDVPRGTYRSILRQAGMDGDQDR